MNTFYRGYDDIAAFPSFKQSMVRKLQNEWKELDQTDNQVLSAYRDCEDRFALVETKQSAFETVRLATENKIGRFSKQDIRELCPSLSVSSIEGALRKLVASGELKREGNGKNTCYYRTK